MDSLFYGDTELLEAFEILVEKGITPEDYEMIWEVYQETKNMLKTALKKEADNG